MPRLADMAAFLDDGTALVQVCDILRRRKAKPTDKVTFAIQGEDPFYPVDSDLWHDWWRGFRRTLGAESSGKRSNGESRLVRCLASGELVEPAATHPKIAGLSDVGGLSMGDALASFKQDSFCSYGLSQSANAPVSEEMAAAYRAALNHLIAEHSRRLAKIKVVHWYEGQVPAEDDPMSWLFGGEEGPRPVTQATRYYALTLSGAAGRVMVRDWMEGPLDELTARIGSWFEDLSIVRRDGSGLARPPKFLAVLGSLVRDLRDLPAPWESMMWRVAVHGERIPAQAQTAALGRLKIEILHNEPFNHARMGLLKAFHVRQGDTAMQPNLNEKHPAAAYQCGRLMAVLAALQYRALREFGVGAVQRTYAAASSTPALVLGRLTRTAQTHLNKLDPGLALWFENRLAEIWNELQDGIPSTLSLEEQSLFALGYYQQLAADRQGPKEAAS
jgi:CRISPR-associated protein Csd1